MSKADTLRLCEARACQWTAAFSISAAEKNVRETLFTSDYTKKTTLLQVWALAYFLS